MPRRPAEPRRCRGDEHVGRPAHVLALAAASTSNPSPHISRHDTRRGARGSGSTRPRAGTAGPCEGSGPAIAPEPRNRVTPTVPISRAASRSAASAPAAAVRMSVRKPLSRSSATGQTGRCIENRHQPGSARQPARRVVVEARCDLDGNVRHALDVCRLDVELAVAGGTSRLMTAGTRVRPRPSASKAARIAATARSGETAARRAVSSTMGIIARLTPARPASFRVR